jgi:hypothetical protein
LADQVRRDAGGHDVAHRFAVRPSHDSRTWTVIDEGYRTVRPVEAWLEAHRHLWSPNTVRGYATSLARWWTFLEQRGEAEGWHQVGVPTVSAFLSWLRNGCSLVHSLVEPTNAPSAQTLAARLAAVVSFYRWQDVVFDVPVAGRLLRGVRPDVRRVAGQSAGLVVVRRAGRDRDAAR